MRYDNFVWREDECFVHEKRNIRYTFVTASDCIHRILEERRHQGNIAQHAALLLSAAGKLPFLTTRLPLETSSEGTIHMPWTTTIRYPHPDAVVFHCSVPDHTFAEVCDSSTRIPLFHHTIDTELGTIFCGSLSQRIARALGDTTEVMLRTWCEEVIPKCLAEDFVIDAGFMGNELVLVSAVKHPTNTNLILAHISMRDLTVLH